MRNSFGKDPNIINLLDNVSKFIGQWLWLSWQSFQYQRSTVRIQSSATFNNELVSCSKYENKEKEVRNGPFKKSLSDRNVLAKAQISSIKLTDFILD